MNHKHSGRFCLILPFAHLFGLIASVIFMAAAGKNEVDSEVARVRSDERMKAQQRLRAAQNEAEDLRRKLDTMLEKFAPASLLRPLEMELSKHMTHGFA